MTYDLDFEQDYQFLKATVRVDRNSDLRKLEQSEEYSEFEMMTKAKSFLKTEPQKVVLQCTLRSKLTD